MNRATEALPDEARGARELLVEADLRRGRMRQSLAGALRTAIQDGRLAAGTVLPASRRLATDLGVSRGVVSDAYDQLTGEGYLRMRARAAPVVAEVATTPPQPAEPAMRSWRYDFDPVTPDLALFPAAAGPGRWTGRCGRHPMRLWATGITAAGASCGPR